jgi:DNA excision repair protein ERCC-4
MEANVYSDPKLIQVIVDHRECHSGVLPALMQLPNVCVTWKQLELGDYEVDGRCLFERKTILDFAASILDGRLFKQAHRSGKSPQPFAIILEGKTSDLAKTGMRREAFQGALISLALIFEIPVLRAIDPDETARLILYAANQLRRHDTDLSFRKIKRPKRRRKIQLNLLQCLPGIGPGRAQALLEHFSTIASVVNAAQSDLETIHGIGTKTAAAICWALEPESLSETSSKRPISRQS